MWHVRGTYERVDSQQFQGKKSLLISKGWRDAYEVLRTYTAHVHCKDRGTENPTSNGIVGTYNKGLRPVSAGDGYKIFRRKPRGLPLG